MCHLSATWTCRGSPCKSAAGLDTTRSRLGYFARVLVTSELLPRSGRRAECSHLSCLVMVQNCSPWFSWSFPASGNPPATAVQGVSIRVVKKVHQDGKVHTYAPGLGARGSSSYFSQQARAWVGSVPEQPLHLCRRLGSVLPDGVAGLLLALAVEAAPAGLATNRRGGCLGVSCPPTGSCPRKERIRVYRASSCPASIW